LEHKLKKIIMATAVCTILLAGPAIADSYIGGGIGESKTDHSQSSWKLYGGVQFNPTWGIELGYNDLGRDRTAGIKSWTFAGTGTAPLNDTWSLIGKLGVASNRSRSANSSNHTDTLVGVGIGYAVSKTVGVRLEYEDFGRLPTDELGNQSRGSNLALSAKYSF
jgi:opacity protein-like surface antigen